MNAQSRFFWRYETRSGRGNNDNVLTRSQAGLWLCSGCWRRTTYGPSRPLWSFPNLEFTYPSFPSFHYHEGHSPSCSSPVPQSFTTACRVPPRPPLGPRLPPTLLWQQGPTRHEHAEALKSFAGTFLPCPFFPQSHPWSEGAGGSQTPISCLQQTHHKQTRALWLLNSNYSE